ncbi:glycine-rich domain-containing protein [uncultured Hoeflea sp.]|uniref:glycine-rich domain-containing protein n=1 Tax=uncultured Hoeflea sp. TaxID=538666 RepID=UPI002636ED7E|nr:hypothetical protein [uncultured Hoeflea sp.]
MKYQPPFGAADPEAPYVDKNVPGAIAGSKVPAKAIEHPQRELDHLIEHAGLTPGEADLEQVRKAIQYLARAAAFGPKTLVKFTTPGASSWAVPAGVTSILVRVWGAGGGGGYAVTYNTSAPSGGASGGFAEQGFTVAPGEVVSINVGAGGIGGQVSPVQQDGQPGLASSVTVGGVTIAGGGGSGGLNTTTAGVTANSPAGGSFTGASGIRGSDGSLGVAIDTNTTAFGGAGGAAPLGGGHAVGGSGHPGPGRVPGGGGGATSDINFAGASGARGEVHIIYSVN